MNKQGLIKINMHTHIYIYILVLKNQIPGFEYIAFISGEVLSQL